jgi:hypothetical protein
VAAAEAPAFPKLAAQHGFTFVMPAGFSAVPIVANRDMSYDFAVRSADKALEVRYALRPLRKEDLKAYEDFKKKPPSRDVLLDPNTGYPAEILAVALNIAGGGDAQEPKHFPPEAVKQEFGADDGLVTSVSNMRSAFGKGYRICTFFVIHKKNVGDAYVFFLANDENAFPKLAGPAFHSLVFAP